MKTRASLLALGLVALAAAGCESTGNTSTSGGTTTDTGVSAGASGSTSTSGRGTTTSGQASGSASGQTGTTTSSRPSTGSTSGQSTTTGQASGQASGSTSGQGQMSGSTSGQASGQGQASAASSTPAETASVLERGLTNVAIPAAIANIDGWIARLQGAPQAAPVVSNLQALRAELQRPQINGREVGRLLTALGQQTEAAAGMASGGDAQGLARLSAALTAGGAQLGGGASTGSGQ